MTLNLTMNDTDELKPRITVFGVGGAGGNAVNNMIEKKLDGVEFVVANTDAQALQQSRSRERVQMGLKVTEGLGAGAKPSIGAKAAEESIEEIVDHLMGAHMCFITAGMGGGTGTGAAPIIAQAARELGVLTVGVVTKPFMFEGAKRMRQAEEGIEALQKVVDTLIIIPNQNLFRLANEKTTFTEAFSMADDVLYQGVKGVTDLMVRPGIINLDFADVRSVMDEMGKAMMGTGEAQGEDRAIQAAEKAIANPLLDEISLRGAKGVLINITGGFDLTLFELDEAANRIRDEVDPDANIIVGSTLDPEMEGVMRVSVVATGIDAVVEAAAVPPQRRPMSQPLPHQPAMREPEPAPQPEPSRAERQAAAAVAAVRAGRAEEPAPQPAPRVAERPVERHVDRHVDRAPERPVDRHDRHAAPDEGLFASRRAVDIDDLEGDDMPPPAYSPRHSAPAARPAMRDLDTNGDPGVFTAPKRPASSGGMAGRALHDEPAPRRSTAAADLAQSAADRARSGLGALLSKMTGHVEGQAPASHPAPQRDSRAATAVRQQPVYDDEDLIDPEQERVEIPAFLRRQAN
ncbi:cell division protein FtsZ [Paracoccus sp. p4-l81]|uniref:cell division protein FtsZ n=1 Tax=unclassified Paracoccus (in: a-proteobacteria) TaxID=2688777 RepID=UPI0035B9BA3D